MGKAAAVIAPIAAFAIPFAAPMFAGMGAAAGAGLTATSGAIAGTTVLSGASTAAVMGSGLVLPGAAATGASLGAGLIAGTAAPVAAAATGGGLFSTISTGFKYASAASQVMGAFGAGPQAAPQPDYSAYYASVAANNQRVAEYNAAVARNQAVIEKRRIDLEQMKELKDFRKTRGRQIALLGKGGVTLDSPTALVIADEMQDDKELMLDLFEHERNLVDYNAQLSVNSINMQKEQQNFDARSQNMAAQTRQKTQQISATDRILRLV